MTEKKAQYSVTSLESMKPAERLRRAIARCDETERICHQVICCLTNIRCEIEKTINQTEKDPGV